RPGRVVERFVPDRCLHPAREPVLARPQGRPRPVGPVALSRREILRYGRRSRGAPMRDSSIAPTLLLVVWLWAPAAALAHGHGGGHCGGHFGRIGAAPIFSPGIASPSGIFWPGVASRAALSPVRPGGHWEPDPLAWRRALPGWSSSPPQRLVAWP